MKDLIKRLARLESLAEPKPRDPWLRLVALFQTACVAVVRGGLKEHESIAEAHCRAVGIDFKVYKREIALDPGAWAEKHNRIWHEILSENGITSGSSIAEKTSFITRMATLLPVHVQRML
jgi:hypothetical protein